MIIEKVLACLKKVYYSTSQVRLLEVVKPINYLKVGVVWVAPVLDDSRASWNVAVQGAMFHAHRADHALVTIVGARMQLCFTIT
jgi:hypothetical protein